MTLELEKVPASQEIQSACEYLEPLARRQVVCVLPDQDIKMGTDPETKAVTIVVWKPFAGIQATLSISDISSLNPVVAIKRLHADKDLKLFGVDLPKFHPEETKRAVSGKLTDVEVEVPIKGHEAQRLLVNISRAMQDKDARFAPSNPQGF